MEWPTDQANRREASGRLSGASNALVQLLGTSVMSMRYMWSGQLIRLTEWKLLDVYLEPVKH